MPTATATKEDALRRNDKVVASVPMPGVPEGTPGRVAQVAGFDWVRYWVYFDNGVRRGSLDRGKLARASEWEALKARRERGEDDDHGRGGADAETGGGDAAGDGGGGGGEGYLHNGILVPQLLLDRSKRARERLGA